MDSLRTRKERDWNMKIAPFKLERYFARYEFTARYLLSSSDSESVTIQELLDLEPDSEAKFHQHWLGYTESPGSETLRQAICQVYSTIKPEEVLVHTGAEEAIFLFMHAVLEPGDHAIVHAPAYQSLYEVARSTGADVELWQAIEDQAWQLDPGDLTRMIRANTKAVVINTPHNPTGYLMPREVFEAVNQICLEKGIFLFCDEVYRESEHRKELRLPAACDINPKAISLGVMSKTYGLPGLRIGWLATHDRDVYDRVTILKDYTTICNSAPSEFLAELALRHRNKLAERNTGIIRKNMVILDGLFERHSERLSWKPPVAGPIAFPKLLGEDVDSFCDRLVREKGVLLVPGTIFGDQENHFRIGFGRKNMPEAVNRFEEFLSV